MRSARVNSPEMIVLGELKGAEAWDLLMGGKFGTAVIAAVHADSTAGAFEALAMAANPAVRPCRPTPWSSISPPVRGGHLLRRRLQAREPIPTCARSPRSVWCCPSS